jgi:outer membrane lipoprotein SlyB
MMKTLHRLLLASLLALSSLAFPAQAQTAATPRIDGFDVEPIARLTAGNELAFTLYGSPGGNASVRLGGSTRDLLLREVESGVYEGTYAIGTQDRINKNSTATANLRLGNQVASSVLDDSLIKGAPARWPGGTAASDASPVISSFQVDGPPRLTPGSVILFMLSGTPGGTATVRIAGVRGKLDLAEVSRGVYEGEYTVRNRDRFATNAVATGNLRLGTHERTMVLGQPLADNATARPRRAYRQGTGAQAQAVTAPVVVCPNCGSVEAINLVEVKGDGSYLGMIGGGVVGALLGSQVGQGRGTTVAQLAGAAGGAFAGNEIEKRMRTTSHYEVVVRLENGGSQVISYAAQPGFRVGSRVRVENGTLVAI